MIKLNIFIILSAVLLLSFSAMAHEDTEAHLQRVAKRQESSESVRESKLYVELCFLEHPLYLLQFLKDPSLTPVVGDILRTETQSIRNQLREYYFTYSFNKPGDERIKSALALHFVEPDRYTHGNNYKEITDMITSADSDEKMKRVSKIIEYFRVRREDLINHLYWGATTTELENVRDRFIDILAGMGEDLFYESERLHSSFKFVLNDRLTIVQLKLREVRFGVALEVLQKIKITDGRYLRHLIEIYEDAHGWNETERDKIISALDVCLSRMVLFNPEFEEVNIHLASHISPIFKPLKSIWVIRLLARIKSEKARNVLAEMLQSRKYRFFALPAIRAEMVKAIKEIDEALKSRSEAGTNPAESKDKRSDKADVDGEKEVEIKGDVLAAQPVDEPSFDSKDIERPSHIHEELPCPIPGKKIYIDRSNILGMSNFIIYLGFLEDVETGRGFPVALKMGAGSEDSDYLKRQYDAMNRVVHKNIVRVYGVHTDSENPFMVMEYVHGVSLRQIIRNRDSIRNMRTRMVGAKYPYRWIIENIAVGIEAFHELGIIHRDIKPDNILVSTRGEVKIIDFVPDRNENKDAITNSLERSIKKGEDLRGTLAYRARELNAPGRPVTPAIDVYSLGIVLFELITARLPEDLTEMPFNLEHLPTSSPDSSWSPTDITHYWMNELYRLTQLKLENRISIKRFLELLHLRSPHMNMIDAPAYPAAVGAYVKEIKDRAQLSQPDAKDQELFHSLEERRGERRDDKDGGDDWIHKAADEIRPREEEPSIKIPLNGESNKDDLEDRVRRYNEQLKNRSEAEGFVERHSSIESRRNALRKARARGK